MCLIPDIYFKICFPSSSFFYRHYYCYLHASPFSCFHYCTRLTRYSAYLIRILRCHDTPPLDNMLCVDLSYLIFRTCLALIKAMMVCMGKDLLAYTAAMAVGVISRKVIYKCYPFYSSNAASEQSTYYSIEGRQSYKCGHKKKNKSLSSCIKYTHLYNCNDKLRMVY